MIYLKDYKVTYGGLQCGTKFSPLSVQFFILLTLAFVASASVYNGTVTFTCTNVSAFRTGSHTLNRDNTGYGQESVRVDVRDGYGTLLFTLSYSNTLQTYSGGIGTFNYTVAPAANPITFTLTSLAGNGLPEQVDVYAEGDCEELSPVPTSTPIVPTSAPIVETSTPIVATNAPMVPTSAPCTNPLPEDFVVRPVPTGAVAFYERNTDAYTGFNLPAGTWYTGMPEEGFIEVWITCGGNNVFILEDNVLY